MVLGVTPPAIARYQSILFCKKEFTAGESEDARAGRRESHELESACRRVSRTGIFRPEKRE